MAFLATLYQSVHDQSRNLRTDFASPSVHGVSYPILSIKFLSKKVLLPWPQASLSTRVPRILHFIYMSMINLGRMPGLVMRNFHTPRRSQLWHSCMMGCNIAIYARKFLKGGGGANQASVRTRGWGYGHFSMCLSTLSLGDLEPCSCT